MASRVVVPKSVTAGSGAELAERIRSSGIADGKVFLKLLRKEYVPEGIRHTLARREEYDYSGNMMRRQFDVLGRMHATVRGSVPEPFFVVLDSEGRCVGYAMECIDGMELGRYLSGKRFDDIKRHLQATARLLDVLREKGMAHGDIRWNNILVVNDERIVLIDPATSAMSRVSDSELMDRMWNDLGAAAQMARRA